MQRKIAVNSMVVTLAISCWGSIIRGTLIGLPDWRIQRSWRGLGLLVWSVISYILLDAYCLVIKTTNTSSWSIWRPWRTATRGCIIILGEGWHCIPIPLFSWGVFVWRQSSWGKRDTAHCKKLSHLNLNFYFFVIFFVSSNL